MTPRLELKGVSKRFGGVHATRDVSFQVHSGEIVGIIGPNGAGKSTLFELISGFVHLDAGSILFDGKEIHRLSPSTVARRGVVRTWQQLRPFADLSAFENVLVGALVGRRSMPEAKRLAESALERVGLAERRDVPARGLSTGQRKRLELARALATGAQVLLLDEVTGGVDPAARKDLVTLIQELNSHGVTIVLIEHDMRVMETLADRVIALHLGAIVTIGEPQRVMSDPGVRRAYMGLSDE
jgi:branched-chain amino acid transport system ATP-binding protein